MRAGRIFKRVVQAIAGTVLLLLMAAVVAIVVIVAQADRRQIEDRIATSPRTGSHVNAVDPRIFAQRLGDKNAPVVVFVHGTGSWSETWRPSMETAVKAGYQAIAIDLPPFGYSVAPVSDDYSRPRQAARLLAALDNLDVGQAVFVAHSFGAAPVVEALMTDPRRARALILVDAALGLDSPQTDGSDTTVQSVLRKKWISEIISAVFLTNPSFTQTLLQSFITEKEKATPQWIALYQRPLSLRGSYQHIASWLPELLSARGQAKSDQLQAYGKLTYPVTMIWGEQDTITPLTQAVNLQRYIPGATLLRIPKAGHIPQIEEPDAFQRSLDQALRAVPR